MNFPIRASDLVSTMRQVVIGTAIVAASFAACLLLFVVFGEGAGICSFSLVGPVALVGGGIYAGKLDRRLDEKKAGVTLSGTVLTVPAPRAALVFDLNDALVAESGWWSKRLNKPPTDGVRSSAEGVWLRLVQGDRDVLFDAEDGTAQAEEAGLPCASCPEPVPQVRRMWAKDVVALALLVNERRPR